MPTLRVLVQRTRRGAHTSVPALSHGQILHLVEAAFLAHALVVNALYGLWRKQFTIIKYLEQNFMIFFQQICNYLVNKKMF